MAKSDIEIIKKPHIKETYTKAQMAELLKCSKDPIYFIENYMMIQRPGKGRIKFKLYDYQKKMIKSFTEHRNVVCLTGRQQGKCVSGSTKVRLKSPNGKIHEMEIEDFYKLMKNK